MSNPTAQEVDFGGLEVVAFESRQAKEMATLIERLGGVPRVAPSMREVPLEENSLAFKFAENLFEGRINAIIFMTGVGTRTLIEILETRYPREKIVRKLSEITVVARGPKPIKVLREFQIPVTIPVPEPNTWREILLELDKNPGGFKLRGSRVAIQEYGASNPVLAREIRVRGAEVLLVPVYRWMLPEDIEPLKKAVECIIAGSAPIILFTNAAQVDHVMKVASMQGVKDVLLAALADCVVCSVGPTCSHFLREHNIAIDIEPEHPKMGALVHEAAKRAPDLLRLKKAKHPDLNKRTSSIDSGGSL